LIFVTGTIGDAALGLSVVRGVLPDLDAASAGFLRDRYELPQPRVALGTKLIGVATAGIDISDGLIADLRHVCSVSRLSATIQASSVPLSPAARAAIASSPGRLAAALTGGDDYEILFTAPATAEDQIRELSRSCGIAVTAIGRMLVPAEAAPGQVFVLDDCGEPISLPAEGWTHFGKGDRDTKA
jgi:thiamine-monophosphate kinase